MCAESALARDLHLFVNTNKKIKYLALEFNASMETWIYR